jgi:non-homologous end joining protein Ku
MNAAARVEAKLDLVLERLQALEARVDGRHATPAGPITRAAGRGSQQPAPANVINLMEALKRSLERHRVEPA